MANVLVAFYSTYGHVYRMAQAVAEGAKQAGADVTVKKFPELIPEDRLKEMGALEAQKQWAHVQDLKPDELADYDAILFGIPTRYGNIPQQVAAVLDRTGGLWGQGKLVGKLGSVFTSTASQHGGQETTCFGFFTFLIHQGMLVAGVPYTEQALLQNDEVMGGSPYGAATIAGPKGERTPTDNELTIARSQGRARRRAGGEAGGGKFTRRLSHNLTGSVVAAGSHPLRRRVRGRLLTPFGAPDVLRPRRDGLGRLARGPGVGAHHDIDDAAQLGRVPKCRVDGLRRPPARPQPRGSGRVVAVQPQTTPLRSNRPPVAPAPRRARAGRTAPAVRRCGPRRVAPQTTARCTPATSPARAARRGPPAQRRRGAASPYQTLKAACRVASSSANAVLLPDAGAPVTMQSVAAFTSDTLIDGNLFSNPGGSFRKAARSTLCNGGLTSKILSPTTRPTTTRRSSTARRPLGEGPDGRQSRQASSPSTARRHVGQEITGQSGYVAELAAKPARQRGATCQLPIVSCASGRAYPPAQTTNDK